MSNYRPLLPRLEAPKNSSEAANVQANPKRKRSQVTKVACNSCRLKKVACSGTKPICDLCRKKNCPCVYISDQLPEASNAALKTQNDTLKETARVNEAFWNYLKNAPVETAWAVLQQLRSSPTPSSVLRSFNWVSLNNPISEQNTARGTFPPVQSGLEFEPMVNNPEAYPILGVPDSGVLSEASFSASGGSPGLDLSAVLGTPTSTISWQNLLLLNAPPATTAVEGEGFSSSDSSPSRVVPANPQPDLLYYDARLSNLDISFWTNVPCSNHVAADAISMYLEINHPMMGLFDVDLFIDDLISHSFNNCSPFLVNSLLAFTMHIYAAKDPEAVAKSVLFQDEAAKLWKAEGSNDSLTMLAGLHVLYQSIASGGQPAEAVKYLIDSLEVAMRMRLFNVPNLRGTKDTQALTPKERRAAAYT